jgi:hypothetical protein
VRFLFLFGLGLCLFNIATINTVLAKADEDIRLDINISPEFEKAKADYDAALENLSDEQVRQLEQFEQFHTDAYMPLMESAAKQKIFQACQTLNPDLNKTHGQEMQHYTLVKFDQLETNLDTMKNKLAKIDFINKKILGQYLFFQSDLQRQLMNTVTGASIEKLIESNDQTGQCQTLMAELEKKHSTAYAPQSTLPQGKTKSRQLDGKTVSCAIGMSYQTNQNYQISTQIVFMDIGEGSSFEFSTKIFNFRGKPLTVENSWVNFGGFDTRFNATHSPASSNIIIGKMSAENVVRALQYMKSHGTVFSGAKADAWPEPVTFESPAFPAGEIDRMAKCVASIEPELASPLRTAGFDL